MKYSHFSIEEREKIQEMLWQKTSIRTIARVLGRSPSSVSREIQRNYPPWRKRYAPRLAHERALEQRKNRGRKDRLKNDRIRSYVATHLKERWSPEQIAGRIKIDCGETISHEAIYQYIYAQIHRGGYGWIKPGKEDFRPYLRRKRKRRVPKGARRCQRVLKPHGISIDWRPKVVEKRIRVGDWESDTVESRDHKPGVNTLVERKTGLVFVSKLMSRKSVATTVVIENRMSVLPQKTRHTITFDNGPENSGWRVLEETLGITCFFAHPYRSCERGTNENTNGLIRDYFPKKTNFTRISHEEIAAVEYALNTRPRKRLGWRTPLEVFSVALQG